MKMMQKTIEIINGTNKSISGKKITDSDFITMATMPEDMKPKEPNTKERPVDSPSFLSSSGFTLFL